MASVPDCPAYDLRVRYSITFQDVASVPKRNCTIVVRLVVCRDDDRLCVVAVYLDDLYLQQLALETKSVDDEDDDVLREAVIAFGVERTQALAAAGELPDVYQTDAVEVVLQDHDLPRIRRLVRLKDCSYQVPVGRDLYCTAASASDHCATVEINGRHAAPTSKPICAGCSLPTTLVLCSHLAHPDVRCRNAGPGSVRYQRNLFHALCEKGEEAIGNGSHCRPGGNECWERLIELEPALKGTAVSAFTIAEELDYLDAIWRVTVSKDRLVAPATAASVTRLSMPCSTRADFEAALSALADVLKRLQIPDDALPEGAVGTIQKDHTLDRLGAVLEKVLSEESRSRATTAVQALRAANQVRVGLQHGSGQQVATAFEKLGVIYEPGNWADNWDAIRSGVAHALATIRAELQAVV